MTDLAPTSVAKAPNRPNCGTRYRAAKKNIMEVKSVILYEMVSLLVSIK